ncbi:MOSC domain-containing protein [Actinoplanes octamycinicus]|uniref:MOSC domain-containing protein n=1 Tax=Actinoplanes octamycinicus TaxID=135948 RepID=UPI0035EBFFB4
MSDTSGTVVAVSRNDAYTFTKPTRDEIVLVAGLGVEGDIHAGITVRHRGRVAADPTQPNLRQVHLIQAELFDEVAGKGFDVPAGGLGENVTTRGLDLLGLPRGTILRFGPEKQAAGSAVAGSAALESAVAGSAVAGGAVAGSAVAGGAVAGSAALESAVAGSAVAGGAVAGSAALESAVAGSAMAGSAAAGGVTAGSPGAVADHPVQGVLAAAGMARLDEAAARAVAAVAEALARDAEADRDPRPAVVVTGLRNPCAQINRYRAGLLKEMVAQDAGGALVRKAGVMGVVLRGGAIRAGDPVAVEFPPGPREPLERV